MAPDHDMRVQARLCETVRGSFAFHQRFPDGKAIPATVYSERYFLPPSGIGHVIHRQGLTISKPFPMCSSMLHTLA